MSSETERCVEILNDAIAFEEEGKKFFYERAAATSSPLEKSVLMSLGKDEEGHRAYLVKLRDDILEASDLSPVEAAKSHELATARSIFEKAMGSVEDAGAGTGEGLDLQILLRAMEVERKGFTMYSKAASEMTSQSAKNLFQHLAEEEQTHFQLLSNTHDYLADPQGWSGFNEGSMLDGG